VSALSVHVFAGLAVQARAQSARPLPTPEPVSEAHFLCIESVRELSDGALVIAYERAKQLWFLPSAMSAPREIGRDGDGPAEYRSASRLIPLRSDTTVLVDATRRRMLRLYKERILGVWSPSDWLAEATGGRPAGIDHRNNAVMIRGVALTSQVADTAALVVAHGATKTVDTIGAVRLASGTMQLGARAADNRPATIRFTFPVYRSEEQVMLFADGWLAVLRVATYRVKWRTPAGSWIRGEVVRAPRVRVDAELKAGETAPPRSAWGDAGIAAR